MNVCGLPRLGKLSWGGDLRRVKKLLPLLVIQEAALATLSLKSLLVIQGEMDAE